MSDDNGTVTATRDGHVFVITVDRADKMNGFTPESVDLVMIPQHKTSISIDDQVKILNLIDKLEESDDVQQIYTNVDFSDEAMELAG